MHIDNGVAARAVPIFRSFWIAGFDGNDHLAGLHGTADADLYRGHVLADYRRARDAGIRCARESVGWRNAASGGALDFATAKIRAECAAEAGVQIVWTLCRVAMRFWKWRRSRASCIARPP